MKISPARVAAFDVLNRIETEKAFSSVLLPIYEEKLSPADRGLCHELTLGVMRRQIYLDKIIDQFSNGKKLDAEVRLALHIGLYQLLFLDKIPAYSAINESVELVSRAKKRSAKGFVNAVLRRATREKVEFEFADDLELISVQTSHPRWLIEKWAGEFGFDEAEQLAAANNDVSPAAFRLTAKSYHRYAATPRNWKESSFVDGCFIAERIDAELLTLAETGEIYFQDEASQMVAGAIELKKDWRFLDVCAAPGGKVTAVACNAKETGNLFVAGDFHWSRVCFLRENCRRQGVGFVNVVQYDAEIGLPFAEESFDVVLVDAPCSGTGTIRHNPEIRYSIEPDDFADLHHKQLAMLTNASKLVTKSGTLIYSTCSLEREENENVVGQFLADSHVFFKSTPGVPDRFLTTDGHARTFPHRDGMDGFFIAAFLKHG